MVDSIQYKNQNSQIQIQTGYEMPQIRYKCIYLPKNLLFCLTCAIENEIDFNGNKLLLLEQIFSKNPQNIMNNWPPLEDLKLYNLLKSKEIQKDKKNEYILEINQIFDKLRKDITIIINDHQKKVLSHLNIIEENRKNIFNIYYQISEKEELKKQLCNNQNNEKELSNYLRSTILSKQKQSQQNEQKLKCSLDNLLKSQQKISFDHIAKLTQQILQNLKQIDFLIPHQGDLRNEKVQIDLKASIDKGSIQSKDINNESNNVTDRTNNLEKNKQQDLVSKENQVFKQYFKDPDLEIQSFTGIIQIQDMLNPNFNKYWYHDFSKRDDYRGQLPFVSSSKPQKYQLPYGYFGFALNVDRWLLGDKKWFAKDSSSTTWIVLYHSAQPNHIRQILQNGFKAGKYNRYEGEICRITNKPIGIYENVCFSDNIEVCEQFNKGIQIGKKKYIFIFQCRVNPHEVRSPQSQQDYYTVEQQQNIRPYRILVKSI